MNELNRMTSSPMIPKPPRQVATIADDDQLAAFAVRMHEADWLVVDTEFRRERTYYPELCLVQIADRTEIGLIDMLAISDPAPLTQLIGEQGPLKVFHAADQDIEVLYQTLGVVPTPVFDTQIAAAVTGQDAQIGYAALVEKLTGTRLAKSQTRMDWSRRPLPDQALAYAADDVRWLAVIHSALRDRLARSGRLAWVEADSAALADAARLYNDPQTAWRRVHAWKQLDHRGQQVLAELAAWREHQAMHANRPRRWIVADDALIAMARTQPAERDALMGVRALPPKTAKRHGAALLAAVERGRRRPAQALASDVGPLSDAQKKSYRAARRALAVCAERAGVAAPTLARRSELERLAAGERDLRMLSGWRADVAGQAILDVMEGRRRVVGTGNNARLEPAMDS